METTITQDTSISEFQTIKLSFINDLKSKDLNIVKKTEALTEYYKILHSLKIKYKENQNNHNTAYNEIIKFQEKAIDIVFQFESKKEKERLKKKLNYNKNRHHNEREKYIKAINSIDEQLKEITKTFFNLSEIIKETIPDTGSTCRICTDNIEFLLASQCGHTFCQDCYKNLKKHNRRPLCPTCRKPIQKTMRVFI